MKEPYVVVIGASSGGIPALLELASALPRDFAAPVLVVQHIGANRSILPELLSKHGPNRAVHASDGDRLQRGTIFIAPPDHHMLLEGDRITLNLGAKENHARPAIDPLFRSAALHWGRGVIGVILSGHLDDGAAGLQAIKSCGGRAIVQDPSSALEPSMPRSALASVAVDLCVPLPEIAPALVRMVAGAPSPEVGAPPDLVLREVEINQGIERMENLLRIGTPSGLTCPDCGGALFELEGARPVRFRCHTGHAFSVSSLEQAQDDNTDQALRSGVRALQEKEILLRRLAAVARQTGQTSEAAAGEKRANEFRQQAAILTRLIEEEDFRSA
ncbi:chemotaxis protein CheB [Variovorax sp. OV329]|uniref:chemotaxis protein CheB n=1 Tax=Variovorax sp. OV329 TaxID=1882825 RepID=UPI0008E6C809|nr:chemotaxis protein CheB [Variovorax sp. OV329]SFM20641.1 two-component system, chemotaxis family, response regulator CheB [Variovorax sp. OV329]